MRILILAGIGFLIGVVLLQMDFARETAASVFVPLAGLGLMALSALTGIGVVLAHVLGPRREA